MKFSGRISSLAAAGFGLPLVLLVTEIFIFQIAARVWGRDTGYLAGFLVYWIFWCILFPWMVSGRKPLRAFLRDREALFSRKNGLAVVIWLIVIISAGILYLPDFVQAKWPLLIAAIPLAVINGCCEEILWRGWYIQQFPRNFWLAVIYPSFGFAVWHLAPLSIYPTENVPAFVLSTVFLGLAYGFIAWRTGSARWAAISHAISGIFALSGMLAPAFMRVLGLGFG